METLKKYWWLFLLVPIAIYILYVYYRAKDEVNQSTARARAAKADKAILRTLEPETNGGDNRESKETNDNA